MRVVWRSWLSVEVQRRVSAANKSQSQEVTPGRPKRTVQELFRFKSHPRLPSPPSLAIHCAKCHSYTYLLRERRALGSC